MNKKRLSVVMAGAMLATSVAPVLAAETTATTKEYSVGQKELLKKYLNDKLAEKEFSTNSVLTTNDATNAQKYLGTEIAKKLADIKTNSATNEYLKSVYTIKIDGKKIDATTGGTDDTIEGLLAKITVGSKIEIFEKENSTFLGQVIPAKEAPKAVNEGAKYEANDLKVASFDADDYKNNNKFVKDATCTKDGEGTIVLNALDSNNSNIKLKMSEGKVKYDLNLPVDKDGNLLDRATGSDADEIQNCVGFLTDAQWAGGYVTTAEPKKIETITVTEDAPSEDVITYKASELYDGTLLTEKGTELLNDIKNAVPVKDGSEKSVAIDATQPNPENGITTLTVTYKSKGGIVLKKVLIKSANKEEITAVYNMLSTGKYGVGIVAGQNRYATAVSVAKESGVTALLATALNAPTAKFNVVLVNGGSLVDGLAAAPLSAEKANNTVSAPLLLTKADSLPKETKDYLNKLVEAVPSKDLSKVTINLVGGKTVLSESLVKELKDMGFSVVRFGGDNREETSLKVASALSSTETFVVGANGEADAMSISAIAAKKKAPIIVSSVHGLTEDATDYLATKVGNTTIIGGEKAITKEEEEKIKEAKENVAGGTLRIAGANRTETNAKILKKYASDATVYNNTLANAKLTVVKNGVNDKEELVDALSAANLGGPIVLADSKLSDEQLSVLLNMTNNNTTKLLQVGLGLPDSIIKSLSKTLDITNEGFKFK